MFLLYTEVLSLFIFFTFFIHYFPFSPSPPSPPSLPLLLSTYMQLAEYGVCTGHEPDSQEFSTVGGWVATR